MLLLIFIAGLFSFAGAHSQEWECLGPTDSARLCSARYGAGPLVPGQDVTSRAPRFGVHFSQVRTEPAPVSHAE